MTRAGKSLVTLGLGLILGYCSATVSFQKSATAGDKAEATTSEMIALKSDLSPTSHLLYLIDSKQKVMSVYEYDSKKTKLKLAAVRQFSADHQLSEFNNEAPFVSDIQKLVRQQ